MPQRRTASRQLFAAWDPDLQRHPASAGHTLLSCSSASNAPQHPRAASTAAAAGGRSIREPAHARTFHEYPGATPSHLPADPCRWLVGRSYRVVYRRDPIPGKNDRALVHSLTHVHGAIYIASDKIQPGEQPSKARAHGGCFNDHLIERYTEAMYATVARHFEDMKAFKGRLHFQAHVLGCFPSCAKHQAAIESRGWIRRWACF